MATRTTGSAPGAPPGPPANGHHAVGTGAPAPPRRLAVKPPAPRRNTAGVALGVAMVAVAALGVAFLVRRADERVAVLAVAREVPAGRTVAVEDLALAQVAADGTVRAVAASDARDVVGRRAAVRLTPGMLLTRDHVASGPRLAPGQAVVGLALSGGQLPSAELRPGDRVMVVRTPADAAASDDGAEAQVVVPEAEVAEVTLDASGSGTTAVSLVVPAERAPAVATAAAAERASLVVVADGPS